MPQDEDNILLVLFLVFAPLSLSAFGGGISVISEIQHQVVEVHGWATSAEFLILFALSRASPGPGSMMLTTLIGLKVAGLPGGIIATLGMFLPSSVLCIGCAALLRRYHRLGFMVLLEKALLPIGAGLLVAGVVSMGQLVSTSWELVAIAIGSSIACIFFPSINPLYLIGAGALASLAAVLWT